MGCPFLATAGLPGVLDNISSPLISPGTHASSVPVHAVLLRGSSPGAKVDSHIIAASIYDVDSHAPVVERLYCSGRGQRRQIPAGGEDDSVSQPSECSIPH